MTAISDKAAPKRGKRGKRVITRTNQGFLANQWQPGQSGNPAGRPKGSRHKLAESFVAELQASFLERGGEVIREVRDENPTAYLRIIAQVIPAELTVKDAPLSDMTDEELTLYLAAIRAALVERDHEAAALEAPQAANGQAPSVA